MVNTVTPTGRKFVVASIALASFAAALEGMIVTTALPSIVSQLGGFNYYSWVLSAFLLVQTATTVVYGRLADLFGRKPILVLGTTLMLLGSLLCGFAQSMLALVAFRALQGLGAGAVSPVMATVIGDLYTLEERSRVQGLMAAVVAVAAITGPLIGAVIVAHFPWAWAFWLCIPMGCTAIVGIMLFLREAVEVHKARLDYRGALLFTIAVISLLLLLSETGFREWTLSILGLTFLMATAAFLINEYNTADPLVPINLWRCPLVATSNAAALFANMAIAGFATVLPLYVQGVLGHSPEVAGFTLTAFIVGFIISLLLSRRLYRALGARAGLRLGGLLIPAGAVCLLFLDLHTSVVIVGVACFFMGFGLGPLNAIALALVQNGVEPSMRGSITALLTFSASLGSTIGATAIVALLNIGLAHSGAGELSAKVHDLLNERSGLSELSHNPVLRSAFGLAIHYTFWGVAGLAVLTLIAICFIPVETESTEPTKTSA